MTAATAADSADLAPAPANGIDDRAVATLRLLAADMVEAAGSGHPGMPLGVAPAAWALWSRFLRHDPADPDWPDRDRFVLSAGHGSALLYALLHLFGYLPLAQLRRFRQLGSATPGHPEIGVTPGVETTTGPLGQGLANAVGMALAERLLADRCNLSFQPACRLPVFAPETASLAVVSHRTWVIAGDGDLMEGISHEAASLAGQLGLGRLTVIFDDNDVTIDGRAGDACTDDVLRRFAAYGWHPLRVDDGNDVAAVSAALWQAVAEQDRPTLIAVRTTIGHGVPGLAGTSAVHGSPLGAAKIAELRRRYGWPDQPFHVPTEVRAHCATLAAQGARRRRLWQETRRRWGTRAPGLAARWPLDRAPTAPAGLSALLPRFAPGGSMATRTASAAVLDAVTPHLPALIGGSADLAGSTGVHRPDHATVGRADFAGVNLRFGVREHAMAGVLNGLAGHGGIRPFGSTFLVFADYLRPALRMSALMELPVIYVFSHDSVAVGEDGPTHQPVEQLESLRLIPGLAVLRPADANETAACWAVALERSAGPTALVLSRQQLPVLPPPPERAIDRRGGWTVREPDATPDVVLAASGSEVALCLRAADLLDRAHGLAARVVSIPWRERFAAAGSEDLTPAGTPCLWVEAGASVGWRAMARPGDEVIAVDRFGASAPGPEIYAGLGFTPDHVAARALAAVRRTDPNRRPASTAHHSTAHHEGT